MTPDETIAAGKLMIEYGESVKAGRPIEIEVDSGDGFTALPKKPNWSWDANKYRRKPTLSRVPLGPEDVPPGSVFKHTNEQGCCSFRCLQAVTDEGVYILGNMATWQSLLLNYTINRNDAKGWVPCWKEVEE